MGCIKRLIDINIFKYEYNNKQWINSNIFKSNSSIMSKCEIGKYKNNSVKSNLI